MSHLDKAFKNTQEERYLLADLILRKLNDKKLLQILNMGHKTSDRETLKELISMSTHPYLTWFLSSKLSMITGVPRNKMSATMMYNPTKGKDMRHMRRNPRIYERELLVELEDKKDAIQEQLDYMLSEQYTENEMKPYILEWERLMDRITDLKEELNIIDSDMETKRNPSHEEHRDTMKKLYEMARASARGTLDVRLLDIAHGAVRIDELDHVLEQCDDKKVCDYAAYKKAFFIDKKMTKNNPIRRKRTFRR